MYSKAQCLTDSVTSLCSEPGITIFKQRCQALPQWYDSLSKGELKLIHAVATAPENGHAQAMEEALVDIQICEEELADV